MPTNRYNKAQFTTSASKLSQCPPDTGAEVAFVGRSNAGKSSALNAITHIKGLARISKTPGRTQLINFFQLDEEHRLVDLPGYGYAKVPLHIKEHWQKTLSLYLAERDALKGLILIMDSRHPMKDLDKTMLEWCIEEHLPTHILLTKADKLKRGPQMAALHQLQHVLAPYSQFISVQTFSAVTKDGVEEVWRVLDGWLGFS